MTATVVAVVVFLCGVLVGRGVPLVQPLLGDGGRGAAGTGLFGDERRPAVIDTPNAKPSAAATLGDELSYYWRLERDALFDEVLRDPRSSVEPPPPVADLPEPPTGSTVAAAEGLLPPAPFKEDVRSVTPESPTASRTVADSAAGAIARPAGFAVQVTALRGRAAAQSVADGLVAKGFPAFVMDPVTDAPRAVFRVRVGPFANRREAERVQQRLETEEHFKPWITR